MLEQYELFKETLYHHKRWLIIGLLICGGGLLFFAMMYRPQTSIPQSSTKATQDHTVHQKQASSVSANDEKILIDIKGAVQTPGVYDVSHQPRLQAVIAKAGGLTEQADRLQVNLAQKVTDGQMIYIPVKGEHVAGVGVAGQDKTANQEKVNLNTATIEALQALEGVGAKKAAQIIAYRETNGGFKKITDLKAVSGIGDKRFDAIKDKLTIE